MRKNIYKGFTLAELLVVVAILGLLVAIAIPIFDAQTEKASAAVCLSNRRSLQGELTTQYLSEGELPLSGGTNITLTTEQAEKYKCPDGGRIFAKLENDTVIVVCSTHENRGYAEDVGTNVLNDTDGFTRKLTGGKTQTLSEYFNGNDKVINSESETMPGLLETWTSVINGKIGKPDQSWVLQKSKNGKGYVLALTVNGKLTLDDVGKTVETEVYYYDLDGTLTGSEKATVKVVKRTGDGNYPALDVSA